MPPPTARRGDLRAAPQVYEPFLLLGKDRFAKIDMRIRVRGGGYVAQVYAIRQAIAKGIVAAARTVNIEVPLVVRLEGTNVEAGKQILADSGLAITSADSLSDAAQKIVAEVGTSE